MALGSPPWASRSEIRGVDLVPHICIPPPVPLCCVFCRHGIASTTLSYVFSDYIALLNEVISLRGRLNTAIFHVRLLRECLHYSVAAKYLQKRVQKLKLYDSISIDDLNKAKGHLQNVRSKFVSSYQNIRRLLNVFDFIRFSWLLS